jgi:proteic killer suppression protein
MVIQFRTRALQTIGNDGKAARKALGKRSADLLRKRLDDLQASDNLEALRHLPGRCHELRGGRGGQFGVDLEHPKRLVFEPLDGARKSDGGFDWSSITAIEIVEIVDYH